MSEPRTSTEQLFARFRDGDPEAFRRLVTPLLPTLRARADRWLNGRLRKKLSVRDLVQDAQVIAFERRNDFRSDGPESLRRWLLGIVDNCARDVIDRYTGTQKRAAHRELTGVHRPATVALRGDGPSPSQALLAHERRRLLHEARARLGHEDQELLRLVHDERLPLREVADRLGCSYQAARKRHGRALLRLGEAFRHARGTRDG